MFTLILQDFTAENSTVSSVWVSEDAAMVEARFEALVVEVKKNFLVPGAEDFDPRAKITVETDDYIEISDEDGALVSVALVEAKQLDTELAEVIGKGT